MPRFLDTTPALLLLSGIVAVCLLLGINGCDSSPAPAFQEKSDSQIFANIPAFAQQVDTLVKRLDIDQASIGLVSGSQILYSKTWGVQSQAQTVGSILHTFLLLDTQLSKNQPPQVTSEDISLALARVYAQEKISYEAYFKDTYQLSHTFSSGSQSLHSTTCTKDFLHYLIRLNEKKFWDALYSQLQYSYQNPHHEETKQTLTKLGWYTLRSLSEEIIWSWSYGEEYACLIARFQHHDLSLFFHCEKASVIKLLAENSFDLLYFPIVSALYKKLLVQADPITKLELGHSLAVSTLEKLFQEMEHSHYKDLQVRELISYLYIYDILDGEEKILVQDYVKHYLHDVSLPYYDSLSQRCSIEFVPKYESIKKYFSLDSAQFVRITGIGSGIHQSETFYKEWNNDLIEVYFNMNNNKTDNFDVQDFDRWYRFIYGLEELSGNFSTKKGVTFSSHKKSDHTYEFEMKFPWSTLGFIKPEPGVKFGFDVLASDNDGNGEVGKISWQAMPTLSWMQTRVYGEILLSNTPSQQQVSSKAVAKAVFSDTPPLIDGKAETIWNQVPFTPFLEHIEKPRSQLQDLDAKFKAIWDEHAFYLLVRVEDDIINPLWNVAEMYDYGWLESLTADSIVWQMEAPKMRRLDNCPSSFYTDTAVFLPKGNYTLHYVSNSSHSLDYSSCDSKKMLNYGVSLFVHNR